MKKPAIHLSGLMILAGFFLTNPAIAETASANTAPAETLSEIETLGAERLEAGQAAQAQVDTVTQRNRELIDEYQAQLKLVQGLETYIDLLDTQLEGQREEIGVIQKSITDVAVMERQIMPLMLRMVSALRQFIAADIPFLPDERTERATRMETLLGRSDVTVAEKTRRVFEAFQIENEYGRTIESYTGKLTLDNASFDAEFLRIGRLALLYRTVGSNNVGYWDRSSGQWIALDRSPWLRMINQGLSVARQEVAPQLIHLPFDLSRISTQGVR